MTTKMVEMGPLWNDQDAATKAHAWEEQNPGWKWTNNWQTTVPNVMSVIEVKQVM